MTTKVKTTEQYRDSQHNVDVTVARARVKLIENKELGKSLLTILNQPDSYFHTILISDEPIEVGDKALYNNKIVTITQIDTAKRYEVNYEYDNVRCGMETSSKLFTKILALPEHFSPKHLQAIVDGKIKDGDEVYVECEVVFLPTDAVPSKQEHIRVIKLNQSSHIKLFSIKEEVTWDEVIHQFFGKGKREGHISYKLVHYLKANFNPPTSKIN